MESGLRVVKSLCLNTRECNFISCYCVAATGLESTKAMIEVLAEMYRDGGKEELAHYDSIDRYLAEKIAPLPSELVLGESNLQLQEIYVPPEIKPLKTSGEEASELPRSIVEVRNVGYEIFLTAEAQRSQRVDYKGLASHY
jgi:hypothetical protein